VVGWLQSKLLKEEIMQEVIRPALESLFNGPLTFTPEGRRYRIDGAVTFGEALFTTVGDPNGFAQYETTRNLLRSATSEAMAERFALVRLVA
jgi:hypothetical protein